MTRALPLGPGRPGKSFVALSSLSVPPSLFLCLLYWDDLFTARPRGGGGLGGGQGQGEVHPGSLDQSQSCKFLVV